MTAVDDRIITRNPCRIRGAGDENPAERPVLTVPQVFGLAALMKDSRFRALVLVVTFASLRWGEAIALRRSDLDLGTGTVSISRQYVELSGQLVIGPPKSRAGTRTVGIPAAVAAELREHLALYAGEEATALVLPGHLVVSCAGATSAGASGWAAAVGQLGVPGLHFHDLRHRQHADRTGREPGGPQGTDGP
jgi:integrase